MTAEQPALAYVYDRHATANTVVLRLRLQVCAQYAEAQGWMIGGWFVDEGDDALTNDRRPAFEAMLNTIRVAGVDTPRVCLAYDWDRLSRDQEARGLLTRRVLHLGAWVETCCGEQRRPDGTWVQRARLTTAPITA
ncbi:recombinase family protein [Streptomyces sp. RB6PN25]|uniref:Recombinase family protein n=1 Tax=Streptomyces humicola TaxID=2953240 RepID=A0ABT1PYZ7_9ACTN|nr:recombinase family protein [Streptomyces humicola]MCQ4081757.1 recombinase family protein [Streptomyces humicola]